MPTDFIEAIAQQQSIKLQALQMSGVQDISPSWCPEHNWSLYKLRHVVKTPKCKVVASLDKERCGFADAAG